ncbi:MAG: nuclease-related domain-containing protein [Bacillota bacterium]|nr:nuclease-related domain-containing protein [Bacillota bacterium]
MPIYPTKLPTSMRNDPKKTAELMLYDYFKENLSPDDAAIYSVDRICNFRRQNLNELIDPHTNSAVNSTDYPVGETDFILVTLPGLLVLEVKGGRVFIEEGTWYSKDNNGNVNDIENPLKQARKNMYAVISTLKNCREFYNRFIPIGYAAVMPRTTKWDGEIVDQRLLLFQEQCGDMLLFKLKEVIGYWRKLWSDQGKLVENIDQKDIALVVSKFAPTVEIKKKPLRKKIEQFKDVVLTLTENQFEILKSLGGNRKAVITGGAGTGKTLLAMEKAKQVAGQGQEHCLPARTGCFRNM